MTDIFLKYVAEVSLLQDWLWSVERHPFMFGYRLCLETLNVPFKNIKWCGYGCGCTDVFVLIWVWAEVHGWHQWMMPMDNTFLNRDVPHFVTDV